MEFHFSIYTLPLLIATAVSTAVAIYAWLRRSNRTAISLSLLAVAITIWLVGSILELGGVGLETKVLGVKIEYIGIAFAPLMWMIFAFNHANQARLLSHRVMALLAIIPTITVILSFTTEIHNLVLTNMVVTQGVGFSYLDVGHGPWWWVHFLYSYILLVVGTFIVLRSLGRKQGLYRSQSAALILAVAAPWLGNISYIVLHVNPDPTPFAFTITVVALAWGIFGFQLIDLMPVAREIVIEEMNEGMIVLDARNHIADINPEALRLLNLTSGQATGLSIEEALKAWPQLTAQYLDVRETHDEISIGEGAEQRWYEIRLAPLNDPRKRFIGRVVTIRDISTTKRAEKLTQSFLDDMKALQQVQLVLSEITDRDTLYLNMITLAQQRLGIDRFGMTMLDEKNNELHGTYGINETGHARDERSYREPITPGHWTMEVMSTPNHLMLWENAPLYDDKQQQVGSGWKIGTALWNGHKAVGFLVCDNFMSQRPLRPYETELISLLGNTFGHLVEHMRAEEQVRQLSRAVEASPTSIVITDLDGNIQYVNRKFSEVTGYTFEEALGDNPRILKSGQTPPETHKQLWQTIAAGKEWHGEFCNRKKNGELYWELASISPILDASGNITHYVAVKEDITEQREVREQVKKQNEYLSILHEVTLELLDRRSLDDLLQAVVDRAAVLLDAPYGEIMLKEGDELVLRSYTRNQPRKHTGDRINRMNGKLTWQAHDTRQPAVLDDYATWPDRMSIYEGTPLHGVADFPVLVGDACTAVLSMGRSQTGSSFKPDEIERGVLFAQLVALVLDNANLYNSALQEIAERKRTEALLQNSETRYRQIVESASDIIYRTDADGYFTYVNPVGLRLMGLNSEADILGKHYLALTAPQAQHSLKRFYWHQLAAKELNTYHEFPAMTVDGYEIWLGQNVQIIQEGDKVIGFQAVARDITDLKRAQDALALARDQALEASKMKSQLLAKVSHELRTPLGGVLGYAELLHYDSFGELSAKQKQATGQIIESANYLNRMVGELLDEAQIEAKTMSLRQERFSPGEILQKVALTMSVLAQNKGLAFSSDLAEDLPAALYGDSQRLQQIMINLLGNAIKFTKTGEVCIKLTRPDKQFWAIQVVDTGAGIPQDAMNYIFEPFRQVNNAITRENRGTGLGLSITKQLVELMGGRISVESKVDQGSTFSIILPIRETLENAA